jgi:hypothetical protein
MNRDNTYETDRSGRELPFVATQLPGKVGDEVPSESPIPAVYHTPEGGELLPISPTVSVNAGIITASRLPMQRCVPCSSTA